jgi:hypothetical protein
MRFREFIDKEELNEGLLDYLAIKNDNPWVYGIPAAVGLGAAGVAGLGHLARKGYRWLTGADKAEKEAQTQRQTQVQQLNAEKMPKAQQAIQSAMQKTGRRTSGYLVMRDIQHKHPDIAPQVEAWFNQNYPEPDPLDTPQS